MKKHLGKILLKDILDIAKYNTDVDIQRNFIWKQHQISALIESIKSNISLGEIKVWKNGKQWDVIDGKQRLTTIREFINGNCLGPNDDIWSNWTEQQQKDFLSQEINVAFQEGSFTEKVKSFININNGEPLTDWEKIHALCYGELVKDIEDAFTQDEYLIKVFGGTYKKTRGESCFKSLVFLLGYSDLDKIENYLNANNDIKWAEYEKLSACCKWTVEVFGDYDDDLEVLALIAWKHKTNRKEWEDNKEVINKMLYEHSVNKDKKYRTCSLYVYYCNFLKCWNITDLDKKRFFDPSDKKRIWELNRDIYTEPFDYYASYQIDHIKPWSKGGKTIFGKILKDNKGKIISTKDNNAQLLTPEENQSKGNKNLLDNN